MVSLGYSLGPLLVLTAAWFLLLAYDSGPDHPRYDRRRCLQAGLGCLVAAVLVVTGAAVADAQGHPERGQPGTSAPV